MDQIFFIPGKTGENGGNLRDEKIFSNFVEFKPFYSWKYKNIQDYWCLVESPQRTMQMIDIS
jgi:hypothetical protein